MKQDEKDLLLKDLCARLPYGVKFPTKKCCEATHDIIDVVRTIQSINSNGTCRTEEGDDCDFPFAWSVRPYLFPLSSMTEEQFAELKVFADLIHESDTLELVEWNDNYKTLEFWLEEVPSYCVIKVFDWLNKNHFDYRGLIEQGLALDATGLNIY